MEPQVEPRINIEFRTANDDFSFACMVGDKHKKTLDVDEAETPFPEKNERTSQSSVCEESVQQREPDLLNYQI